MKITYTFVTGESMEVEVNDELGTEIREMEYQSSLRDRAETRRHDSIEQLREERGFDISDPSNPNEFLIERLALQDAMARLTPKQQDLIQKIYFEGMTIAASAKNERVDESAIRGRLNRIIKQLKKYF